MLVRATSGHGARLGTITRAFDHFGTWWTWARMAYGQATVSTWLLFLAYLIATVRNGPRIERWIGHFAAITNVFARVLGLVVLFATFGTMKSKRSTDRKSVV